MTILSTREQGVALVAGINCLFYFMSKLRSNACIAIQAAYRRLLLRIPVNACCSRKIIGTLNFRSQAACKTQFDVLQGIAVVVTRPFFRDLVTRHLIKYRCFRGTCGHYLCAMGGKNVT
jgi:hypothetical protein